jgi:hypothetical protein
MGKPFPALNRKTPQRKLGEQTCGRETSQYAEENKKSPAPAGSILLVAASEKRTAQNRLYFNYVQNYDLYRVPAIIEIQAVVIR